MSLFNELSVVLQNFDIKGELISAEPYGEGHINRTYLAVYSEGGNQKRYILQKINTAIFTEPVALMENIDKVTKHIRTVSAKNGKDPKIKEFYEKPKIANASDLRLVKKQLRIL